MTTMTLTTTMTSRRYTDKGTDTDGGEFVTCTDRIKWDGYYNVLNTSVIRKVDGRAEEILPIEDSRARMLIRELNRLETVDWRRRVTFADWHKNLGYEISKGLLYARLLPNIQFCRFL